MTKIKYISKSMHGSTRKLLDEMVPIIEDYEQKGYRLTVRQVYYQLVSRNIIPNEDTSYRRTSKVLEMARMTGQVDWYTIVDRARVRQMDSEFPTIGSFVDAAINSYRCFRWDDQDYYLEVLVEKEALAGILEQVTSKYHVSLLANKGYPSASAMHDVAQRMITHEPYRDCLILYMGDHDPSGIDMPRDIRARLEKFGSSARVNHIALSMDQINEYDLPPNPAKTTDPRSRKYYEKHGKHSWELDALDPDILVHILESHILEYLDVKKYNDALRRENNEKKELERAVAKIGSAS